VEVGEAVELVFDEEQAAKPAVAITSKPAILLVLLRRDFI
jgi:hypothetical protein